MTLSEALEADLDPDGIEDNGSIYAGHDLSGLVVRHAVFRSVSFSGAVLADTAFSDTVFDSCDFSNVDLSSCHLTDVVFSHSRLTGALFRSSRLKKVCMKDCTVLYSSFDSSLFRSFSAASCDFSGSSFSSLQHRDSSLVSSVLCHVSFRGTPLAGLSLLQSQLDGIILSEDLRELRGASVDPAQAMDIMRTLGAVIIG